MLLGVLAALAHPRCIPITRLSAVDTWVFRKLNLGTKLSLCVLSLSRRQEKKKVWSFGDIYSVSVFDIISL